jgi:class 3 adenylate cyclase
MAAQELHTFLFADISGYSRLTELNGDEAAAEIAIRFADAVARLADRHGAEVVKWVGDGVMVHSTRAAAAIELGLDLHDTMEQSPGLPPVHVGIHTGPALARAGDWWGATVNVTARVADAAEAGQLLITEATRLAAGGCSARLRGLGSVRLRNISLPVSIYAASPGHRILAFGYRRRPAQLARIPLDPRPLAAQA